MKRLPVVWAFVLLSACRQPTDPQGMNLQQALGGVADDGFARATGQRELRFPADHAAHPAYRNEWWYVTGNLDADNGDRYGFQVTFFRIAVAPQPPDSPSVWAGNQIWMAHVALTDAMGRQHFYDQRLARGAAGLAGQQNGPFRVWLEDWRLVGGEQGQWPWQLDVATDAFSLQLSLTPLKAVALQGEAGLSRKSDEVGNASWYYSMPRLRATGSVRVAGKNTRVSGLGWLDREWSTSALDEGQAGWDWFSLQLADGNDLMFYRLRRNDGSSDPNSAGKWMPDGGGDETLAAFDVTLKPLRVWQSPSGRRYPVEWKLSLPAQQREFRVRAVLDDQEMNTTVIYWEGAVDVLDEASGAQVGRGYLEMVGYPPE